MTNGSAGLGVSGGLAYGSTDDVGEPKPSWAGDGRPLSCASEPRRGVLEPDEGGRGVPTIFVYGSQGEEGRDPVDEPPGENICGDWGWEAVP